MTFYRSLLVLSLGLPATDASAQAFAVVRFINGNWNFVGDPTTVV